MKKEEQERLDKIMGILAELQYIETMAKICLRNAHIINTYDDIKALMDELEEKEGIPKKESKDAIICAFEQILHRKLHDAELKQIPYYENDHRRR